MRYGLCHDYSKGEEFTDSTHEYRGGTEPHMTKKDKDPRGGLTSAGRAKYNKATGGNLKPGVRGAADTPEKQRRKGSFLRRHYAKDETPPLKKPNGEPTRYALQARAWGEPVPQNQADVRKLAAKGARLLERYRKTKD